MDPFFLIASSLFLIVCVALPVVATYEKRKSGKVFTPDNARDQAGENAGDSNQTDREHEAQEPNTWIRLSSGLEINHAALTDAAAKLFIPNVCEIITRIHRELMPFRSSLMEARQLRQQTYNRGHTPGYSFDDVSLESRGDWKITDLPEDLLDRRVEITGPASDAKMVINMLSRDANGVRADAAMLDMEDSMKPSWSNVMDAIGNIREAATGELTFIKAATDSAPEKVYTLDPDDMPLLMVRVRGLHLMESNLKVDGETVPAAIVDLVLSACFSASALLDRGKTPKYYVPKVEHYLEARWWDRLFHIVEEELGLSEGTLRVTFLIETLPAAFQMEEILYEVRHRAAGLNGGRWDKIFSDIKVLREHPERVLADRASIGMDRPWMRKYALHLIDVCHRHGAFAMGGMAAFTPGRTDKMRLEQTAKVIADKELEASIGHDGCWVSHPFFIEPARKPFAEKNQLSVQPDIEAQPDLLPRDTGIRSMDGLRTNIRVGIAYMKGWNENLGCVAWDNLMEDLATLEISRAQTWQWLRHSIALETGEIVTRTLVAELFDVELMVVIEKEVIEQMAGRTQTDIEARLQNFRRASSDAKTLFLESEFRPFLTCESDLEVKHD